ncbi:hypothetical protein HC251_15960 [Iamia sp. SCSIO 61187]|uniref:hypothetical protein n=1 Tax=Iamia sp. SCSIO 61187 TaxID=2722752 RepID=UPI001C63596B|nr:hypothetical protein [Iamia sp. SCSIO 61187]QYG93771.1 hypothetical protein HC251_15960 [Iamia sp. SCSIO 61187]
MPTELLVPERRSHPAWMPLTVVLVALATVGVAGAVHRPRWDLPPLPPPAVPGLKLSAVVHVRPGDPVWIALELTNETRPGVRVSVPAREGAWDVPALRAWAPGGGIVLTVGAARRTEPTSAGSPPEVYDGTTRPPRPPPPPPGPPAQDPSPSLVNAEVHGGRFTIEVAPGGTVTGRATVTPWPERRSDDAEVANEGDVRVAPRVRVCVLVNVTDGWRNLRGLDGPPAVCTDVVPRR